MSMVLCLWLEINNLNYSSSRDPYIFQAISGKSEIYCKMQIHDQNLFVFLCAYSTIFALNSGWNVSFVYLSTKQISTYLFEADDGFSTDCLFLSLVVCKDSW